MNDCMSVALSNSRLPNYYTHPFTVAGTGCTANNGNVITASAPFNTITASNTAAGTLFYSRVSCDATCTQVGR